ncbi:unnamed protein product [Zymoseptoria tritici ST99CH_1A5]|uniref:Cercosporin MFS transporter CTB4 n=1 Tax=Zymoseptoria tritici ST99CH_1A5 TaxID=1276529 RepID=A0A1Y6L6B0_ZYMTR|nr:unnamed protein product [Zymoseptoria tritici ST99CH_1A5]
MATFGARLEQTLSRPTAKPYRSGQITDTQVHLNERGNVGFGPDDIENPKNWSTGRRWYITVVAILLTTNATFASSSPSANVVGISEEFGITVLTANLVTTLFLLGYCFGPLFWAPLSEYYGRRFVFYISFIIYAAFNFLGAFTPTFAGLLIGRFITGVAASCPLSNAPGVLADLWPPIERGNAMVVFSIMTVAGPASGPVVAGFLELTENWRWTFYVLLWLSVPTLILMFTIPETLPSKVLTNKARRIRAAKIPGYENVQSDVEAANQSLKSIFRIALTRPWRILIDPISLLLAIYLSVVYALIYMLFTIYPIVFQEKRGWNSGVGSLPLIGQLVGALVAGAMVFYESTLARKKMMAGVARTPEDRMPLAMIGGIGFPVTMFWFAWSANYNSIHWAVPTLGGTFLATSTVLLFVACLNYLSDTYLIYAASAVAANTVCRSLFGAISPLFTKAMFDALGVGGAGSLIGGIACLLAPLPFIFFKYGARIRERSKFAPTEELKPTASDGSSNDDVAQTKRDSFDAEAELDEQVGLPMQRIEKGGSRSSDALDQSGDPYLDADGIEKAERLNSTGGR